MTHTYGNSKSTSSQTTAQPTNDVRTEKVVMLQARIAARTYHVPSGDVAEALMRSMLR